ncbi:MAG: hypothetical protein HOP09_15895 [Hyphomicrobium sp.]|nr:hypothetical protein [Hyphomicrobium sp.]
MSSVLSGSIALCALPGAVYATEMGRAPVQSGTYATLEGGYLFNDSNSITGHGISTTGLTAGPTVDTVASARDGWFAGISAGIAAPGSLVDGLPFNRAEAYFSYRESDDGRADTVNGPAATTLKSVDGSALGVVGNTASTGLHHRASEGGLRFAYDQTAGDGASLSFVVSPFVRNTRDHANSVASGTVDTAWRNAEVETWQYGVTLAVEPEVWLTQSVALVGRAGGGLYYFDAEGSFQSHSSAPSPDPFAAALSDNASGLGFRGTLGVGIKIKLADSMTLTGFAEADYFSKTAGGAMPDNQFTSATTSAVALTDSWELRTGVRLSIGLGSVEQ